jgi:transketolase
MPQFDPNAAAGLAARLRARAVEMVARAAASHIGGCLSMADILAVLYGQVLHVDPARPDAPDRDRLILSKGHGAAILYATLAERGFFPIEQLKTYCQAGSHLTGHTNHHVPGVEVSTGSLGHGLPIGCGMALAAKKAGLAFRVFVILSDGELDEGSNWEAILFAAHHRLDNLVAIVDYNRIQSFGSVPEVLELEPLEAKWKAFNWTVRGIDGHDPSQIYRAVTEPAEAADGPRGGRRPTVVIAHTIKGKGVGFMEHQLAWHYQSPKNEQLDQALAELRRGQ